MTLILNPRPASGAVKSNKRVGRGIGSGHGKTSTRGSNGAGSRSGNKRKLGFEGGQMPLQRRPPKRGFTNIFKKEWIEISLGKIEENFTAGDVVTPEILHERGLIKKAKHDLVVLGTGEVSKSLNISAHRFTKTAKEKIEKGGGTATVIIKYPVAEVSA